MPFAVEQSEKAARQARRVAQRAQLNEIRILEVHAKVVDPEATENLAPIDEFATQVRAARTDDDLVYRFEHDFTFKGTNGEDAVKVAVHVGAAFDLHSSGEEYSEEEIAAFGSSIAQMAVYPYVRATVSDLTTRLGCAPVTLDLLVLGPARQPEG